MLSTPTLRLLGERDREDVLALLRRDPVANVFVASRVLATQGRVWRLGGELWGHYRDGRLDGVCYSGANLVPGEADEQALTAFAERARRQGRRCSSIVGPADQVEGLWARLAEAWGPAREVRADQPLMAIDTPPQVAPDDLVRLVEPEDLDVIVPACVAMFTEEVGVSPLVHDGGGLYRARVAELVHAGRAFARFDGDRVVFKAEVGAVGDGVCQVQGVWVDPELRGQGLSAPGMAAVVALARAHLAPVVSLYLNAWNAPALRAYARVGFRDVGRFATVLF